MSVPWSRCGSYELHPWHYDVRDRNCPGWTLSDSVTRELVTSVRQYLHDHYPDDVYPAGLRVELHPAVSRLLMINPDLNPARGASWEETMAGYVPVPLKVTAELPRDGWRLVVVTEEVLLSHPAASS